MVCKDILYIKFLGLNEIYKLLYLRRYVSLENYYIFFF